MTTGRDIVEYGLKKAGVTGMGRAPSAAEGDDALADLNDMLAEWNQQRWLVWGLLDVAFTSTGAATYTVGPGGDFNVTPRPARIEAAFQRQFTGTGNQPVDTPMKVIASWEEYSRIAVKGLQSFGLSVFLDTSTYPTGTLRPYPVPNATIYQIHLLFKNVIPVLTLDTDLSTIPDYYMAGMKFNLARRLRQAFGKGKTPDVELNKLAKNSLNVIINSNIQIPEITMPRSLANNANNYNILSDQFGSGS